MGIVFGKTGVSEPAYDVITVQKGYEIRSYGPRVAITTPCDLDNTSFMSLASYIGVTRSPQNTKSESISMTAPVVKSPSPPGGIGGPPTMSFILPAKYDKVEKAPAPTDPNVAVVALPPAYGAVSSFSGRCGPSVAASRHEDLLAMLGSDGVQAGGAKWELWQYNPPFTIPWMRRNEVFVELSREQAEGIKERAGGGEE
ncbi:hypothetical protein TrRE_jg13067 [Triparma retinervis]|uniref:SOUL heme-binding protein n=1 Tax=Triparma retinervis TaxID=2557542 RepID=A0A9W7G918_9STRA|nr:hypothetical protein TrRE_jg13067 [Triparma retinervis]